jgi:hypothetical protein
MTEQPQLLHKYRSLDAGGLERVRQTLITKTLWFSRPSEFNDPFDCFPVSDTVLDKRKIDRIIKRANARKTRGAPRGVRTAELRRSVKGLRSRIIGNGPEDVQRFARNTLDAIREDMGVLSLSADPVNVLMWSHYASNHTGVVLSFRDDRKDIISEAMRVIYNKERPVVDLLDVRERTMEKTLLRKADYWSYEKEWRVIKGGKPGNHGFDPSALIRIVFGLSTLPEHEASIRQAAAIGGLQVRFGRTRFCEREFRLEVIDA